MTEERKQKLRQLLEEARESLVVRHGYGGESIPLDVYRKYLKEFWTCYGVSFFSWALPTYFTLKIENERTNSRFFHFIKEELAQYIRGDDVSIACCKIECDPPRGSRLSYIANPPISLQLLMERLLEITLVQGIEAAVSVLERYSAPEGVQNFFQHIVLLEGIKIETEIPVYEGVRLVPLPSPDTSEQLKWYLRGIPYLDGYQFHRFFRKTLLVIDRSGFSVCQKPAPHLPFQDESLVDDLPFQIEVPDVKFLSSKAVDSFKRLSCQALSLVCNTSVEIVNEGLFVASDKSFNLNYRPSNLFPPSNWSRSTFMAGNMEIRKAKRLYEKLDANSNSEFGKRLQIAIDRWIKSKTPQNPVDQMIDLGIALEALYATSSAGIIQQVYSRAARHLGKGKGKDYKGELRTKFEQIYRCRGNAVHDGTLDETATLGDQCLPISEFIAKAQDWCWQSIMKVLEDGELPT